MSLTPAWLDELRARTMLSALIGRNIKVSKAGREFKACCPFHNEKTPSFTINDDKGFYHCFGCGAHGDAIRWMTDQRGLPFIEAVKELAQAAGMEMPEADPRAAERAERANSLHDVMHAAADWFAAQLAATDGTEARRYLHQRGIKASTIADFALGYAPDSRGRLRSALSKFGDAMLVEAGLLIAVEGKEPYDRFRGRLMIPIRDPRGRVIAFGGRILGAGEPKYLNSPDTPLFDKGRTLYNLDRAAAASRKTGRVVVVEGYMDVIALAQAGIDEAVAPLGTALTEHQLERLWRLHPVPILCFDGDAAGQKASVRAIGRALPTLAPAQSLAFLTLPKGQDPDDLIRASGRIAFDKLLDTPEALVDRLWRHELDAVPLTTPEARAGLKARLNEHAQAITDPDVRDQYRAEFKTRFDTAFLAQPQRRQFTPGPPGKRGFDRSRGFEAPPSEPTRAIGGAGIEPSFARAILAGLIHHPATIVTCGEALAQLGIADFELDRMRQTLLEAGYRGNTLDSAQIIAICETINLGNLARSLINANGLAFSFTQRQANPEVARRDLAMAIEALAARPSLDAALAAATARLSENWDDEGFAEQQRLIEEIGAADRRLYALAQGEEADPQN